MTLTLPTPTIASRAACTLFVPRFAGAFERSGVCVVGGWVCLSAAHPQTADMIHQLGFKVETVDVSEFAKAEGCVTCMSLLLA